MTRIVLKGTVVKGTFALSTPVCRIAAALAAVMVVSACSGADEILGTGKRSPDEFAVYSRAPLSLPPDFSLRPPEPGRGRPQNVMPRDEARAALLGRRAAPAAEASAPAGASPGLHAVLQEAGAFDAEPNIRQLVNSETSILAEEDQSFTERLMFWGTETGYGTVVEPEQEARRIQENQALGRPITEGETPTIERKRRALLEGIFN